MGLSLVKIFTLEKASTVMVIDRHFKSVKKGGLVML